MQHIYIFLLLLIYSNSSFTQDCYPDPYYKRGGHFPYCIFLQNHEPYLPLEGICSLSANGKVYAYYEFKNGQIMVDRSYDETGVLISEFKRVEKDSITGVRVSKPDGIHLGEKTTYYLNKQGKRCWKEEKYLEGNLSEVRYYRNFTVEELANSGNCVNKKHESDSAGYTNEYAMFGKETMYYPNGKVMSITEHQLIISDCSYHYRGRTQHGEYVQYAENGVEIERGTYNNGQQNGEFIYHHPNGKLAGKKYFENGISVGNWVEYDENGKLLATTDFGEEIEPEYGHEKRYFPSGKLQYESVMYKHNGGFIHEFYENGTFKENVIYHISRQEETARFNYFPNGNLEKKTYLRPTNDTMSIEYYPDGFIKSVALYFNENHRQERRSYYPNHRMEFEEYIEVPDSVTHQVYNWYRENGTKKLTWETHGNQFISKEYWGNERLKSEKHFERESPYYVNYLNGYWIEQDSLGTITRQCHYTKGFRDGACEVTPKLKLAPLTAEQEKCLLPLAIHQITQRKYDTNIIIDEKQINEEVNILRKVEQFLISTYFSKFQFNCDQNTLTTFEYSFYSYNGEYAQYKTQIDSILKELKWEPIWPIATGGDKSSGGRFNSTKMYSPAALDSIFNAIVPNASRFFILNNVISASVFLTDNNYYSPASISLERKEVEKAWLAHVYGNEVVVYDDGMIEFFNGTKFTIPEPPLSTTTTPIYEWKSISQGKVKAK